MNKSYIIAHHIISALGFSSEKNFEKLVANQTGIRQEGRFSNGVNIPLALIAKNEYPFDYNEVYTQLENLFIHSIQQTIAQQEINIKGERTLLILSTTKGNIDLLRFPNKNIPAKRVELGQMGNAIQQYFGLFHRPIIVSNACISGVMALIMAHRFIRHGKFDQIIVSGGDIASEFVISGFNCLKAISDQHCRPFDKQRNGVNLGEAVGTALISSTKSTNSHLPIEMLGGSVSNDANHISGPSRDGEGLAKTIEKTISEAQLSKSDIDFISAHGTATIFNDEMESKAIHRMGLASVPVNSFKGYIGHTLGAAGVVETIMSSMTMQQNILIKSIGYEANGVEMALPIITENKDKSINHTLKLASGFGGCNASLMLKKVMEN